MKFPYRIGVELTGIPRVPYGRVDFRSETAVRKAKQLLRARKILYWACGQDDHCLEIPTKPVTTLAQLRTAFNDIRGVMKDLYLRPHHPDTVCGGGHIHVGIRNSGFALEIFRDVCERYYLPWVFSQADEATACDNLVAAIDYSDDAIKELVTSRRSSFLWASADTRALFDESPNAHATVYGPGGKAYSISITGVPTIEFRFFEAARNWNEQWDQLDFLLRYLKFLKKRYDSGFRMHVTPRTKRQLNRIQQEDAVVEFRKLLGTLGLKYARYKKYVDRNLRPRWELGRTRR